MSQGHGCLGDHHRDHDGRRAGEPEADTLGLIVGADGRIRAKDAAPAAIEAALATVPNSTRWKRLTVNGGPGGFVVTRKQGEQRDWLCDLWLAERLASK